MTSGRPASTIAVTGVGDNSSLIITMFDADGRPIGHAELSKRGFGLLIQAGRDVTPSGAGFGELTVSFEISEDFIQERKTEAACSEMSFKALAKGI